MEYVVAKTSPKWTSHTGAPYHISMLELKALEASTFFYKRFVEAVCMFRFPIYTPVAMEVIILQSLLTVVV